MSPMLLMALWFLVAAITTWLKLNNSPLQIVLYKLQIICGFLIMLSVADAGLLNKFARYSIYTMPVFLFHEPLLTVFKKISMVVLTHTPQIELLIFLIAPVITILICVVLSAILTCMTPKFYRLLTGGRQLLVKKTL